MSSPLDRSAFPVAGVLTPKAATADNWTKLADKTDALPASAAGSAGEVIAVGDDGKPLALGDAVTERGMGGKPVADYLTKIGAEITASTSISGGADGNYRTFAGRFHDVNSSSEVVITILSSAPSGLPILMRRKGTGAVRFVAGSGMTLRPSQTGHDRIRAQWAVVSILVVGTDIILDGHTAPP